MLKIGVVYGVRATARSLNLVPRGEPLPTITVSLRVENRHEDGDPIITEFADVVVLAPPLLTDAAALGEWSWKALFPFTGTGQIKGDSWYDVEVTACSDPALVSMEFGFGY
jgi:hypothetical protein